MIDYIRYIMKHKHWFVNYSRSMCALVNAVYVSCRWGGKNIFKTCHRAFLEYLFASFIMIPIWTLTFEYVLLVANEILLCVNSWFDIHLIEMHELLLQRNVHQRILLRSIASINTLFQNNSVSTRIIEKGLKELTDRWISLQETHD